MVAIKSILLTAVAMGASLVAATDSRRLIDLPDLTTTCKLWNAECKAYTAAHAPKKSVTNEYCQKGSQLGGTADEFTAYCSFTTVKGKTTDVTAKVVKQAGFKFSA